MAKGRIAGGFQRGARNPNNKLTDAAVGEIRRAYALGRVTQTQLAEKYGVSQKLVSDVVRREIWQHVQ